jgi:hypothetical protein
MIEVTTVNSAAPVFIPGFVERELTIQTTGDVKAPDAIVFDGKRFIPEPGK